MFVKQISITTSRTHWRAGGIQFVQGKPKLLDVDGLNKEQARLLVDDPELLIKELDGEAELSNEPVTRPDNEADVLLTIQTAALNLPKSAFTKESKPRVADLEKALGGWKASGDEIDKAIDGMAEDQKALLAVILQD